MNYPCLYFRIVQVRPIQHWRSLRLPKRNTHTHRQTESKKARRHTLLD
ncbi:hypothetical protein Pmani_040166 [Petrolisthes manimaculis]|uniref:Uncharacterized protein n=1 Tax=Petrolisthes manimaculis TaxID=1843537 RepID=A0AAE1TIN9_9EUCA|nr:hypothetical protein Pmani_040166 [Petrolisthes manimaculis]